MYVKERIPYRKTFKHAGLRCTSGSKPGELNWIQAPDYWGMLRALVLAILHCSHATPIKCLYLDSMRTSRSTVFGVLPSSTVSIFDKRTPM